MSETFRVEQAYYNRRLKSWLRAGREGQWVVIKKKTCHGFYFNYPEAKRAARDMKLKPPALIRKIAKKEEKSFIFITGIFPAPKKR